MKKHSLIMLALYCLLACGANAQQQTLLASLPKSVIDRSAEVKADVAGFLGKLNAMNPGLKNKSQLNAQTQKLFLDYKASKPELKAMAMPALNENSYAQLIADKEKELGVKSPFVAVLKSLQSAIETAPTDDEMLRKIADVTRSDAFASLTSAQKDIFYNSFSAFSSISDYGRANKMIAEEGWPVQTAIASRGPSMPSTEYVKKGEVCHWLVTMAGAAIGAAAGPIGAGIGGLLGFGVGASACYPD